MEHEHKEQKDTSHHGKEHFWKRVLVRLVLCILILSIGVSGYVYLKKTAPRVKKKPPVPHSPVVEVARFSSGPQYINIPVTGTIVPARQVTLKSQVAGEVVWIDPELMEGSIVKKGQQILRIDPREYEFDVIRKKSIVVRAMYALKIEQGHQDVAKREWAILSKGFAEGEHGDELALRKPHLEKVKAELLSARADLEQAELDLKRTTVTAPFNSIIREKFIETGSLISTQDKLVDLTGIKSFRVMASVRKERLEFIKFPANGSDLGSDATIVYSNKSMLKGRVVSLLGSLESEGRMARILISMEDPLGVARKKDQPRPLIGEYVRVEIQGEKMDAAFAVPRTSFREGNNLWIADDDGKLEIRHVDVIWKSEKSVFIKNGLSPDERVIVSDLPIPINGMGVSVSDE